MAPKNAQDLAASVRARLLNIAKAEQSDFNAMLVRYALERFLYRLGQSAHADHFVLKGAMLFNLRYAMPHRPTRDVDLLGFGASDLASIAQTFREIVSVAAADGMVFDTASVVAERLHAMVLLGMTNSRVKDYLDVWILLERETLDTTVLATAIAATFQRRATAIPITLPMGLSDEFANDASRQALWAAFLRKNDLATVPLGDVVTELRDNLLPALVQAALLVGD